MSNLKHRMDIQADDLGELARSNKDQEMGAASVNSNETGRAKHRETRLKLAALTSLGSKVATICVQVFAIPLAIKSLGVEQFGLYVMLASSVSWISWVQLGLGPSLTLGISSSVARDDEDGQGKYFSTALFTLLPLAFSMAVIIGAAATVVPIAHVFGPQYVPYSDTIRHGIVTLAILIAIKISLSVVDATQAGYQEHYICNLWGILGNTASLVALLTISHFSPSVESVILAISGAPLLADILNGFRLVNVSHKALRPRISLYDKRLARDLIGNGVAFSIVSASGYLAYQLSSFQVGRALGPSHAATFSLMLQVYTLLLGGVIMFVQPLWPALNDAVTRSDISWARVTIKKATRLAMVYAVAAGAGLALFGQPVFKIWLHGRVHVPVALQIAFGIYFMFAVWEYIHYNFLVGLNNLPKAAAIMIGRSVLIAVFTWLLIPRYGILGAAIAMTCGQILTSAWLYPLVVHQTLDAHQKKVHQI